MLNIWPETTPGVYPLSIQAGVLKRVAGFTLLRLILKGTQKRKTGYFKVSFKNGVIHQAAKSHAKSVCTHSGQCCTKI